MSRNLWLISIKEKNDLRKNFNFTFVYHFPNFLLRFWNSYICLAQGHIFGFNDPSGKNRFQTSRPHFNTSVQHKDHPFSAPKSVSSTREMRQFNTKNPQSNTLVSSTQKLFLTVFLCWTDGFCVMNWRVYWAGFFVLKWRFFVLNWLWGWKVVVLLCWTDVWNTGGPVSNHKKLRLRQIQWIWCCFRRKLC